MIGVNAIWFHYTFYILEVCAFNNEDNMSINYRPSLRLTYGASPAVYK